MRVVHSALLVILLLILSSSRTVCDDPVWGFYGHRLINKIAVYTLPPDLFGFYKEHIDYMQQRSVAPDKRRYATPLEAYRHYIDLDIWEDYDPEYLRQDLVDVVLLFADWTDVTDPRNVMPIYDGLMETDMIMQQTDIYSALRDSLQRDRRLDQLIADGEIVIDFDGDVIRLEDQFALHGIVPYTVIQQQRALERAFESRDVEQILTISAELGHYIADAHVPLHTTENYNGQLTGQDGIHAFWETRIPELFAEAQYDFFVEPAEYIEDMPSFIWEVIMESHSHVDDLLAIELQLRDEYPVDHQYCYDSRGGRSVRVPCREYAAAYQERMGDMVEERMRAAISSIGSVIYTSYVLAGMPDLDDLRLSDSIEEAVPQTEYEHEMRTNNDK